MAACDNCAHQVVCGKYEATGGHVRECEHFKEERRGEWKPHMERMEDGFGEMHLVQTGVECPYCGGYACCGGNFCKNCGADMRGEQT